MKKKIIIIGAGIAGLSTGCYGQMNGYDTEIFEQHTVAGGLCTGWKRGGYSIDGCIHWLLGSGGDSLIHTFWNELGALQGRSFIYHDVFTQIEVGTPQDKKIFTVYSDADRLNAHMKALAPEDAAEIDIFTGLVKKFSSFPIAFEKPFNLMKMKDFIALMKSMKPFMKDFNSLSKMTISDYAKKFSNSALREGFEGIMNMDDFSLFALVLLLSWQHARVAGYPVGGSLEFAQAVEKKYASLDGTVRYSARVEKILVKKNRAVGIRLDDGSEHFADEVVSASDGYTTIFKMLDGRYVNKKIRTDYETLPLFEPFFCLSLGVNRDFSREPAMATRLLQTPIEIEGEIHTKIGIRHFCYDQTLAPEGKSVLQIMYTSDYERWAALKKDAKAYSEEKKDIAVRLIGALETLYPGITEDIEVTDTATPITYERYTGNHKGTFEGWFLSPKTITMNMKKTLPGLKNFYMAGQWVQPGGGLPNSLKSGRDLILTLCNRDRKEFCVK